MLSVWRSIAVEECNWVLPLCAKWGQKNLVGRAKRGWLVLYECDYVWSLCFLPFAFTCPIRFPSCVFDCLSTRSFCHLFFCFTLSFAPPVCWLPILFVPPLCSCQLACPSVRSFVSACTFAQESAGYHFLVHPFVCVGSLDLPPICPLVSANCWFYWLPIIFSATLLFALVCLSNRPLIRHCQPTSPFIHKSAGYPFVCHPFACVGSLVHLSVCPPVCLSLCLRVSWFICLSICPAISPSAVVWPSAQWSVHSIVCLSNCSSDSSSVWEAAHCAVVKLGGFSRHAFALSFQAGCCSDCFWNQTHLDGGRPSLEGTSAVIFWVHVISLCYLDNSLGCHPYSGQSSANRIHQMR